MADLSIEAPRESAPRDQLRFYNISVCAKKVSAARGKRERDRRRADAEIEVSGRLKEVGCIENRE